MTKTAIITGVTGQDGSYLADLLIEKDYTVIGLHRRTSIYNFHRIEHLLKSAPKLHLDECDLTDSANINSIIAKYKPDELYNLAAQSHVGTSFKQPITTFEIDTIGVINILEAIKSLSPATKFYQASTSEMYGSNYDTDSDGHRYQDEKTNFMPQSPYGVAKLASHRLVQIYRDAYGMFCCSGILFNHESPRRGENFVTKKITKYIGQIINNIHNEYLLLGNLSAQRDWGHAKDYVRAMWLMLQQPTPDDYVIATGNTHTVEHFAKLAFDSVGLNYNDYIRLDPSLYRPAEVEFLKGVPTKANKVLEWQPEHTFEMLVKDMVDHDCKAYFSG